MRRGSRQMYLRRCYYFTKMHATIPTSNKDVRTLHSTSSAAAAALQQHPGTVADIGAAVPMGGRGHVKM